jgi:hypothetical protein
LGYSIPSEKDYEEQGGGTSDFKLLPADDYIVEVAQVTEQPNKKDIFADAEKPRFYLGLEVRLKPISFSNGDELVDEDGGDIVGTPLFFDWLDTERVGLKPQPAKARKFFAAALGVPVEDRIDLDDFQDLVGKRLVAVVITKPNAKGVRKNKVSDYRPIRNRGRRAAAAETAAPAPQTAPAGPLPNQVEVAADAFSGNDDDLPF